MANAVLHELNTALLPPGRPSPSSVYISTSMSTVNSSGTTLLPSQCTVRSTVLEACDLFRSHLGAAGSTGPGTQSSNAEQAYNQAAGLSFAPALDAAPYFIKEKPTPLRANLVSFPVKAATVPLLKYLPPRIRRMMRSPASLIEHSTHPYPKPFEGRAYHSFEPSEYAKLVLRVHEAGGLCMSTTQSVHPVIGWFGVWKKEGESQRLLTDGRPPNGTLPIPPKVSLPGGEMLASLQVPKPRVALLHTGESDVCDYFHMFCLPRTWWSRFPLPRLKASELHLLKDGQEDYWVYPFMKTLPMGFFYAVWLAQTAHEYIMSLSPLLVAHTLPLSVGLRLKPDVTYNTVYIDNVLWFHVGVLHHSRAWALLSTYIKLMEDIGFTIKKSELAFPTTSVQRSLGFLICNDLRRNAVYVAPRPTKILSLQSRTRKACALPVVAPKLSASLTSEWTWFATLRRPILAFMSNDLFRFNRREQDLRPQPWHPDARANLLTLCGLMPIIYADISMPASSTAYAFDASGFDGNTRGAMAVVSTDAFPAVHYHKSMAGSPDPQLVAAVSAACWRRRYIHVFRRREHSGFLEASAGVGAATVATFFDQLHHTRVWSIGDAQASLQAFKKGRSSSVPMNARCKKHAVLQLSFALSPLFAYVPSELMPADRYTRLHDG
jgi:hypothetical protein